MPTKILLAGYLGCGNLGDDALMASLVLALPNDIEVVAMSGDPDATYRHHRIMAIGRKDLRAFESTLATCDALVFPGGSILQDSTSVRSVFYYAHLITRAKSMGKKVVMLSQGIGPLKTFLGKRQAGKALRAVDALAVRDPMSLEALRELGLAGRATLAADLAFLLPPTASSAESFGVAGMKTVGLAPRAMGKDTDAAALFSEFSSLLFKNGWMPVIIPMDRHEDMALVEAITKVHGGRVPDLRKAVTPQQIQDRLGRMDALVAVRLHAGILGATVGIPPLMIDYDPKVAAFAKMLELGPAVSKVNLSAPRLLETFLEWQKRRPQHDAILGRKRSEMVFAARKNVDLLLSTLGRPV